MLKITKIRKVIHKGMGTLGPWPAAAKGVLKKGVLENFSKLTGKQSLRPAILLKETLTQVFFCTFCEIFKNTIFTEHLQMTAPGSWQ